jgi:3-oxoacyl-[acyl-carrier-protein] synthase II
MRRRVVITGVGCVTPLGSTIDRVWNKLVEGHSGIGRLTLFDAANFAVQIAGEVRDWDMSDVGEDPWRWRHHPRQTHFAVASAIKAYRSSGLVDRRLDPVRFGVYLGCGETYQDFFQFARLVNGALDGEEFRPQRFSRSALQVLQPEVESALELDMPACHIAGLFDAQGPNVNCIAACASSAQAIGQAAEIIRRDEADIMLAGGAHSMIHPFGLTGFQRLEALSTRNDSPAEAVRPFDRDRDGFVLGEGGAMVVLESLDHATRRGAEIWGELTGFGSAQDAYRVTDAHPEGRGAASSIASALTDARLNPDQIGYINAHGTSTVVNDKVETEAIKRVFGSDAHRIPISSTKSMLGHFTTACGAIELIVSLLAVCHGVVPPTINYHTPDPVCDLDYVPNMARRWRCRHAVSTSLGFGGQNAALVVSRYDGRRLSHPAQLPAA